MSRLQRHHSNVPACALACFPFVYPPDRDAGVGAGTPRIRPEVIVTTFGPS